ncbi:MAG TPA: imidazole glycerol phosphate synthase subunit HisH [Terriglobia bacterium]|jgi:imidazole glycerol phosphate synthase glutamine amidotransferase subunit|nr:imidazole glycerol phosphate synthase subunit HisH [Terriglobia bacterium]
MIGVINYGAGNVGSVLRAVQYLGCAAEAIEDPALLPNAEKLILPGQGHFGAMMEALKAKRMIGPLREQISGGKPFLGICLGLQALYESSEEAPGEEGFGLLPGRVKRFEGIFKVPHLGWSQLEIRHSDGIFEGVPDGSFAYFCHSYYGPVTPETTVITEYAQTFAAAAQVGSVYAVQFHPEKSGDVGLKILENFLKL